MRVWGRLGDFLTSLFLLGRIRLRVGGGRVVETSARISRVVLARKPLSRRFSLSSDPARMFVDKPTIGREVASWQ